VGLFRGPLQHGIRCLLQHGRLLAGCHNRMKRKVARWFPRECWR
jgi:hypothetical protein